MSTEYNDTSLGDISVNNEVIKNIALKAAVDTGGVERIKKGLMSKISDAVKRKDSAHGVRLEFSSGSELKITLKLMVEYGVNIPYVAGAVQENVKKAVENMTGLTVTEVGVKIVEIQGKKKVEVKNADI
jgi:uncharacterized alkaline shock family protein YloU